MTALSQFGNSCSIATASNFAAMAAAEGLFDGVRIGRDGICTPGMDRKTWRRPVEHHLIFAPHPRITTSPHSTVQAQSPIANKRQVNCSEPLSSFPRHFRLQD